MIRPRWGGVVGQKTAGRFCLLMLALPGLWMGVYFIYPIYKTLQLSFYDWNGLTTQIPLWVGWENYRAILTDRVIPLALGNNLKVFFQGAIVQLILSFILGVLIVQARSRMGRVFLVISYVPHMIPLAVVGFLCSVVFAGTGPLQAMLAGVGFSGMDFDWLGNEKTAFWAIVLTGLWASLGFTVLCYTASLKEVPDELVEAARVDGAGLFRIALHVLLPFTWSMSRSLFVLSTIGAFLTFELVWVMTLRTGGPLNSAQTLVSWLYTHMNDMNFGYAAALSAVVFALTLVGTVCAYAPVLLGRRRR